MAVIKFCGFAPKDVIDRFKFGSVYGIISQYVHAREKKLVDFNLAVERHTAKLPNLIPAKFSSYTVSNGLDEEHAGTASA